jgi:Protein of unknown function (DUF1559)
MPLERPTIVRYSKAAFWLGMAAIVCGIVSFATLIPLLFQIYLMTTLFTLGALVVLRWSAGRPLNNAWAMYGTIFPVVFLGLSIYLIPLCLLVNNAELRTQSSNSLRKIALGLLEYQEKQGHLPAASICDSDGKPLLSWRVAILPFLDENALYSQFNLDEPWDSAWNRGLLKRMPAVYRTPLPPGESAQPHTTFYQVFVGPGTAFEPRAKLQTPRDFPDGIRDTILLVEAGIPVPWTKPEDLNYDPKGPLPPLGIFRLQKGRFPWSGGEGSRMFAAALCDGSMRMISDGITEKTLRNAITRNDGELLGNDW